MIKGENMNCISGNMKEVREFLDIPQNELAKRTGLTPAAISQIESGAREPQLRSVIKIAEALGVSIDRLVYGLNKK